MTRRRPVLLIVAFAAALMFAGCGGGDSGDATAAIDEDALQAAMPGFSAEVAADYGQISPPIFVTADQRLLGFTPQDVDPVEFCNRLSDYLASEGFDAVPLWIVYNTDAPGPLATGESGSDCEAS